MLKRSISGIVFVGVMLAALLVNQWLFAAVFIFVMVGMMVEFYRITLGSSYRYDRALAIIACVMLFASLFTANALETLPKWCAFCAIPFMGALLVSVGSGNHGDFVRSRAYISMGVMYIGVPVSLSTFLVFGRGNFSGMLLLFFFIMIWASDVGAYCVGSLLGKNGKKMAPTISPNKSWAGFWGGMAFSVAVAAALVSVGELPLGHSIALAVIMHCMGVCGDLFESQIKRAFGVKDSGNIIPGHGGLLDRFDSSLFAIPSGMLYLLSFGLL